METSPMAGKSWQPNYEPPRQAEGLRAERNQHREMGLMAKAGHGLRKNYPHPMAPADRRK